MLLRYFLLVVFLSGAAFFPGVLRADPSLPVFTPDGLEHFPAIKLRGYGTLSAERKVVTGDAQDSVLLITCESEAKAKLVLAKYLSDLGLLPGVTPLPLPTSRGSIRARQVEGQGVAAGLRCGKQVFIITAGDVAAFKALLASNISADIKIDATEAEIPVPMYLDRWDKYGFRFYYGPFTVPQDADHHYEMSYNPTQDFTFAKQSGDAGLVVWNSPYWSDNSYGIMDINSRQWVYDAAKPLKLPLGINIGVTDQNDPLVNRYPADMAPNAPSYLGGWYGALNFGGSTAAWSSAPIQDVALGQLQPLVRDLTKKYDNIVNWLEPHEEMSHGECDLVDDHGPHAKDSFHAMLKEKYGTPEAVAERWSEPGAFHSWDDIPFPELATFLGWNAGAFDLTGTWKLSYEAPYGNDSAKADLDDSKWSSIDAPGNAIARVLPRKPAVFRRHFKLDAAWRAAHPKIWAYIWDFNDTRGGESDPKGDVLVFVNGKAFPETPPHRMQEHWGAYEITSALTDGDNVLTICLPQAILDYRCYLSGEAPGVYPALTPQLNAEWADFSDWTSWSRGQAVRRGAQMIRQVDPDRPITMMSPGLYLSDIRNAAEDYGGIIHDTGGMAGFWNDYNPVMAESTNLPTDCEPGGGAPNLEQFKDFMGRWSTENTQGVDYFQHIGDVLWHPDIKDYFQKTLPLWHLMGKYHTPHPEVALLDSLRNQRLYGFPWNYTDHSSSSPDLILGEGLWAYPLTYMLQNYCPRAGIVDDDFARGNVDQFRIVIDSNTTIMDPALVEQIAAWVKRGGIFVTYMQTGRHTSVLQDSWPISKLTGYAVTSVDSMTSGSNRHLHLAAGQKLFHIDAPDSGVVQPTRGLSLRKEDAGCQDLLQWDDGSIAAGMRHLGKGIVINLGTTSPNPLVMQILDWAKVKRVSGEVTGKDIIMRHFISNNGLYDVWTIWNTQKTSITTDLIFHDGLVPANCRDVNTGGPIAITPGTATTPARIANIPLDPLETRAFLTPRGQLANASAEWLTLQRSWWRGTASPGAPIPAFHAKLALNLTEDWAFKPIDGAVTGTPPEDLPLVDPKLDDSKWERRQIGIYDIPDHPDVHNAMFRKTFTVPAEWNHGQVLYSIHSDCFNGNRQYIDGKIIHGIAAEDALDGVLKAGSKHTLAFQIWGSNIPVGTQSPVWITYIPDPLSQQDLPKWSYAADCLTYGDPAPLPLSTTTLSTARCVMKIDSNQSQRNVVAHLQNDNAGVRGLIINGHWINAPALVSNPLRLNLTPWVKFGHDNELIIVFRGTTKLMSASLDYYEKSVFP